MSRFFRRRRYCRFTVEGALNRDEESVTLLVDGTAALGQTSVDGREFQQEVELDEPGQYRMQFDSLEGQWTIENGSVQVPMISFATAGSRFTFSAGSSSTLRVLNSNQDVAAMEALVASGNIATDDPLGL